jgi:hypothetical protein
MSYCTKMWALATLFLAAFLTFSSTNLPARAQDSTNAAAMNSVRPLIIDQNLPAPLHADLRAHMHAHLTDRLKRSLKAFAPIFALLFVTLMVLDTIGHRAAASPLLQPAMRTPDFEFTTTTAEMLEEWPREFDLIADEGGWIAVRREPQLSRYGGN